ncbi:hypothetical protein ACJX0J_033979, partial [Zea mays]
SHINNEYLKLQAQLTYLHQNWQAMHLNNWHHIKYFIKPDAVGNIWQQQQPLIAIDGQNNSKASFRAIEEVSQLNHKTCTLHWDSAAEVLGQINLSIYEKIVSERAKP